MRQQNPYYQDPTADIGQSLATAIFGNPAAAQAQAQARAQIDEHEAAAEASRARAMLTASQARGVDTQNGASISLPTLFAAMQPHARAAPPETLDGFLSPDYQPQPAETQADAVHRGLPAVLAAMAQMNGDKVDPRQIMGTLGAFSGNDELARAALVAQGNSPTKDFAITPDRADNIAATAADADYHKSIGVATTNHANDIPVANIRANASRDVAITNNRDDIPVAQIAAGSRENVAGINAGGNGLGSMIAGMYPGARVTSQDRTQARQNELIAEGATKAVHSYHVPGNGGEAVDMAAIPGKSLGQFVGELRARGADVIEAKNEGGGPNDGTGPHWHIAVRYTGKPTRAAQPKTVSAAMIATIDNEISLARTGKKATEEGGGPNMLPAAAAKVRRRAAELVQQGVDPVNAADRAIRERRVEGHTIKGRHAQRSTAGASSARNLPGGSDRPVEIWGRDAQGQLRRTG